MQGARTIGNGALPGTVQPGSITDDTGPNVFKIGDNEIIDIDAMTDGPFMPLAQAPTEDSAEQGHDAEIQPDGRVKNPRKTLTKPVTTEEKGGSETRLLGRPKDMKGFSK